MGKLATMIVLSLAVGGCNSSRDSAAGVKGLSQGEADRMNADRSQFDSAEDPVINAETRFAAGQLAESQGVPGAAVDQYREALKVNPKHQPSLYRLAVVYTQQKAYPQAIEAWRRYLAATDNSANAYSNLGFCYELAGKTAEAEASYKAGIAKDPKCQPCRVNYGLMLTRTGRVPEARAQLETVLKPAEAAYNIGSVLEQIGRKDQAREEYNRALKLDPNFQQAQARLSALN
jgi:tetratricopeptide (TPR) repeat protein